MGIFDFFSKKQKNENSKVSVLFEQIKSSKYMKYKRYILVKGENLISFEDKIREYQDMYSSAFFGTELESSDMGEWKIIKISHGFNDRFEFHNFVFWFLGYPPEDTNYADSVIGLALSEDKFVLSYLIYFDDEMSSEINRADEMAGLFENGETFVLNIPEDNVRNFSDSYELSFSDFFILKGIDIDSVKSGKLNFKRIKL